MCDYADMSMYVLAGVYMLVFVCIWWYVSLSAGRYLDTVYAGKCVYVLVCVCRYRYLCVYSGRFVYMLADVCMCLQVFV